MIFIVLTESAREFLSIFKSRKLSSSVLFKKMYGKNKVDFTHKDAVSNAAEKKYRIMQDQECKQKHKMFNLGEGVYHDSLEALFHCTGFPSRGLAVVYNI